MGFNTRIECLPIEVIERITMYLHAEDLIRFFETFALSTNMMSPKFISMKILQICESKKYGLSMRTSGETWDEYIELASREYVTRYSPKYIGINKSLRRTATINDMVLLNMFINYVAVPKVNDDRRPADDSDDSDYPDSEDDANDDRFNWGLVGAAKGGHMHIVKLMIEKGANDYNGTMCIASLNGHMNIINLMLEKGANNYDDALYYATICGYTEVINLMLEKGAKLTRKDFLVNI